MDVEDFPNESFTKLIITLQVWLKKEKNSGDILEEISSVPPYSTELTHHSVCNDESMEIAIDERDEVLRFVQWMVGAYPEFFHRLASSTKIGMYLDCVSALVLAKTEG